MAWPTNFSTGSDVSKYEHLASFWRAVREREWAIGNPHWPRRNIEWDNGTTALVTNTTMRDDTKAWETTPARWVSYMDEDTPWFPGNYEVVIDCENLDHSKHVHARITSHTADTLTIESIKDYVTAGWIDSVSELADTKYIIIKRDGLNWGDRWPKYPNDYEHWRGEIGPAVSVTVVTCTLSDGSISYIGKTFEDGAIAGEIVGQIGETVLLVAWLDTSPAGGFNIKDGATVIATGTTISVQDGLYRSAGDFPVGEFNGKDLLIYGGELYRIPIDENTSSLITFDKVDDAYNGNSFSIVDSGGRAWPSVTPDHPFHWYRGATTGYYTQFGTTPMFSEDIGIMQMPIATKVWSEGTLDTSCENVTHTAFDTDLWSAETEECSEADKCYSPDLFKTLRAIQLWIELNCQNFVPKDNYHGKRAIPSFSPATLFKKIDAGYVGTFAAIADGSGDCNFTITGITSSDAYHWTVIGPDGNLVAQGYSTGLTHLFGEGDIGETYHLVVARGWSRKYPREFRHAYPRSAFIPDIETDEFGSSVVDPPNNEFPGHWESREPSDNYIESDQYGFTQDTGPDFIDDVRARYIGDNWTHPAVQPYAISDGPDGPLDSYYYRDLWMGKFNGERRVLYDFKKVGQITYGGTKWFRQDVTSWWSTPIGRGELIEHSGEATGGSTTTLTDTTQTYIPDGEVDPVLIPFWNSTDNGPRFAGMMLEVTQTHDDVNDDPQTVTYRTPITGHSDTTVTFAAVPAFTIPETDSAAQIDVPALSVSSGDSYSIREPYRRNWFRGMTVKVTKGSESHTTKVTYNDDQVMWMEDAASFDIDDTCTFVITELSPGYVYKWDEGEDQWNEVTDTAFRGNEILPDHVSTYGLFHKGDYVGGHVFKQLYDALNELVWTPAGTAWTSRQDGVTAEKNYGYPTELMIDPAGDGSLDDWERLLDLYEGYFDDISIPFEDDGYPPSYSIAGLLFPTSSYIAGGNSFAYGVANPPVPPVTMNRATDFFALAWVNDSNTDSGTVETITEYDSGGTHVIAHGLNTTQFDNQGTGLLYRRLCKYSTAAPSTSARIASDKLGNSGYVPPVNAPDAYRFTFDAGTSTQETWAEQRYFGYHIAQHLAVVRWDVEGGFTYTKPASAPLVSYGGMFDDDTPTSMDGSIA